MKKIFLSLCLFFAAFGFAQVPAYVSTNGLIGFWPFNNNANDQSVNANNGTVMGATSTSDRFNNPNSAYHYNGFSDYIIVPDNPTLSGFNDMSISVWIKVNAFAGIQAIVAKWYQEWDCNNNSDTYEAALVNSQVQFATNNNNISAFFSPPSLAAGDLNVWKHLVYIHNSQTGGSIYINAVLAATDPVTGPICNSINSMYFGADYDGNPNANVVHRYFNGDIDDIGMWNRVITPCEIQQLYTASVGSLNASSSNSVSCIGMPVTLTASGMTTYTWSNGSNGASIIVTPTISTSYTVSGTNTVTGCSGTSVIVQLVSECLGVKQNTMDNEIRIYPNPANNSLFVEGALEGATIEMTNILGEQIYKSKIEGVKHKIDLSQQSNGVYFVIYKTSQGTQTKKIIKE